MVKKSFLIFFLCLFFISPSFGEDFDIDQIDNPFGGQKPVTKEEFNKVIESYKPKAKGERKGFWNWFFKKTLPNQEPSVYYKEQYEDIPSEMNFPKEVMKQKPSLTLSFEVYDSTGKEIPQGYYVVSYKDGKIQLHQGTSVVGEFSAKPTKDNWEKNEIIYARVESVNDLCLKIIYSNLNECYVSYVRIKS